MTLPLLAMLAVALVLFYWAWIASPRSIRTEREQLLREQGQASGATFFPVDPRRMRIPVRLGHPFRFELITRSSGPGHLFQLMWSSVPI